MLHCVRPSSSALDIRIPPTDASGAKLGAVLLGHVMLLDFGTTTSGENVGTRQLTRRRARARVCVCVRACVHAYVCVCLCVHVWARMSSYVHVCACVCVHHQPRTVKETSAALLWHLCHILEAATAAIACFLGPIHWSALDHTWEEVSTDTSSRLSVYVNVYLEIALRKDLMDAGRLFGETQLDSLTQVKKLITQLVCLILAWLLPNLF